MICGGIYDGTEADQAGVRPGVQGGKAVELLINGNRKAVELARNLGIRVELLYRWKNEYLSGRGEAIPGVEKMCRSLAVSRSGFYGWNRRGESMMVVANRLLLTRIERLYESTKGRYGSPRITAELQDQGYSCSGRESPD